jgi:hypothetical protein
MGDLMQQQPQRRPVPMFRGSPARTSTAKARFVLTLEALPAATSAEIRLRQALKLLLRAFRFRCVAVQEQPSNASTKPLDGLIVIPPGTDDDPSKWLVRVKRPPIAQQTGQKPRTDK